MKASLFLIIFASSLTGISVHAQEVISLDAALEAALAYNHQIRILHNQQAIAENTVHPGNAGLLPTVSVGGSFGGNVNNTELEFAGGIPPVSVDNALSTSASANATLNYVLFSGMSGLRNYRKLIINKMAVDEQSRAAIESTMLQVASAYYILARAIDQEHIAGENLEISQKRYARARIADELGTSNKAEYLSARVDLTTDSSTYINATLQRRTAERNLARLTGLDPEVGIGTEEAEIFLQEWTPEQLDHLAMTNNAGVKNLELQALLAEKDVQLSWSSAFPTVSINGGYNYTNQQNEAGIILSNTTYGWNGNIGLSYTLFNGFRNSIDRQNQRILLESSELRLEDQKLQVKTDIRNALDAYRQSVQLVAFEEGNLNSSRLNVDRYTELLKAGQITSTQFREAQLAFLNAQYRISNAKISVKLNELEIMRLTGQILSTER